MLPNNRTRADRLRKLRLFPGPEHPGFTPGELVPLQMPPRRIRNKFGLPPDFQLPEARKRGREAGALRVCLWNVSWGIELEMRLMGVLCVCASGAGDAADEHGHVGEVRQAQGFPQGGRRRQARLTLRSFQLALPIPAR